MEESVNDAITDPVRLWSRAEVLARPGPTPNAPGIYGWYFDSLPIAASTSGCVTHEGRALLYVGISPHAPARVTGVASRGTLRKRLRTHLSGNASASTLRLTLGLLIGLHLRVVGSGRLTFGVEEEVLNQWMAEHARVTWAETPEPWLAEKALISRLDLPLNVQQNNAHPYWPELSALRRTAKAAARLAAAGPTGAGNPGLGHSRA